MTLVRDDAGPPSDLRRYEDHQIELMLRCETGKDACYLREVLRLRKIVVKLLDRLANNS